MKKLLSLLSVLTISGTAVPTTIASGPYQKEKNINNNINLQTNNLKNLIRNKRQPNNNVNYNIHINEIAPENPNWCEPAIAETILRYLYEIYHPNHNFPLEENWNGGSFQNYFVNNTYNPIHDRLEPNPQNREQLELHGHMGINYFEEGLNWFINHFNLGDERYIFHERVPIFEGGNWFANGITNGLRVFYDYVVASLNRNLPPILFFHNFFERDRDIEQNNNILSFGGIITGVVGNVNDIFDLNSRFLNINTHQEILIPAIFLVFILENQSIHFYRARTDAENNNLNNNLNQNNANNYNGAAPAARSSDYLVEIKNYKLSWIQYEFQCNPCIYYYDLFSYSWKKIRCFPQKNKIWIPFIEEKIKDENIFKNNYLRSSLENNSNRDKKIIGCSIIPKKLFKINTKVKLKENNSENLLLKKDQILFGTDYGFYLLNDKKIEKKFTNIINSPVIEIKLIDNNNGIFRLKNNKVYSFNLKDWNYKEIDKNVIKNKINKYNSLSKEKKQQKLNEINQHYQKLSENDKKVFKDKLRDIGLGLTSTGISGAGILGISKITGISPIKGLSNTANYIKNSLSTTNTAVSTGTGEAVEMTPLLSESTVAEGLTAFETLSVAEGTAVIATEGTVIGAEAGTAAALAPETLGLSLVIGGLIIAGTALIWWFNDTNSDVTKYESHNQYNEIEKYYKFLAHDQLKLDININEWDKIKQIYQENSNNYQEFKNKIKSEITNFHKEDHGGWGGSITDEDINILINIIYNHFQVINNHFSSDPNHGWKIVTNTIGSYFMIEKE